MNLFVHIFTLVKTVCTMSLGKLHKPGSNQVREAMVRGRSLVYGYFKLFSSYLSYGGQDDQSRAPSSHS